MDTEALSQLIQIKWLLVIFVVVVLLNLAFRVWLEFSRSDALRHPGDPGFRRNAQELLEKAQYRELLVAAQARCLEAPGDVYAFWYHAYAAHGLGDLASARKSMERVGELAPDWREQYAEPFIRGLTTPQDHDREHASRSAGDEPPTAGERGG